MRPMTQIDPVEVPQRPPAHLIPGEIVVGNPPRRPTINRISTQPPIEKRNEMRFDLIQVRLLPTSHTTDRNRSRPTIQQGKRWLLRH